MLTVDRVSKAFADVAAVRRVSVSLASGQIMALVGASGSGKSTLLSIMAGLADADEGEVRLDGERVPGPSEVLVPGHPNIRLVHQEYQLMPNVSVRENIVYALRFYEKAYREYRVDALLKRCRLTAVQHRLPRQVSGGEKQRAAIARAIADLPAVLLLDEPFSHLDLPNRQIVRELLFEMVRQDKTACAFVTHDAADALAIADTLGILRAGKLVQLGSPVDVYRHPATAYAAQLTGPVNLISARQLSALGYSLPDRPDAVVCLRPEQIRLVDAGGIPALVRSIFFKGSHYEIEVAVSQTLRLRLLTPRDDLTVGQSVAIALPDGPFQAIAR